MHTRQIQVARIQLQHAGTPANQEHYRSILIRRAKDDLQKLGKRTAVLAAEFRRTLSAWRTEAVAETVVPFLLLDQIRRADLYCVAGFLSICGELGLAAWIFNRLKVTWWYGGVAALVITGLVHGLLHLLTHREDRPRRSEFLVTRYAGAPAFGLFLVALAVGSLARYVYGWAALLLLPLFNGALWVGTFCFVILSAALFTVAHILNWSRRYTRRYEKLDCELSETNAFLDELDRSQTGGDATAPRSSPTPLIPQDSSNGNKASISLGASIMLIALAISAAGCSTTPVQADPKVAVATPTSESCVAVVGDRTGSPVNAALNEGWKNARQGLPKIIEDTGVRCVTVYGFDGDGWALTTLLELQLPIKNQDLSTEPQTEWRDFANVDSAIKQAQENRQVQLLGGYRNKLREALKPLESLQFSPQAGHEPKSSDIVGLLRHIAYAREGRIFIVITDVADTRYREEFPEIQAPPPGVSALLFIVPAKPKDCIMTLGRNLSGAEQFQIRSEQLRHAVPWLSAVPYFERNIEDDLIRK